MRFQLVGTVSYWERTQEGHQFGREELNVEFDAENIKKAEIEAQNLLDKILAHYSATPFLGSRKVQSCKAELRKITVLGNFTSSPKPDADITKKILGPYLALNAALEVVASGASWEEAKLKAHALGCTTPVPARLDK